VLNTRSYGLVHAEEICALFRAKSGVKLAPPSMPRNRADTDPAAKPMRGFGGASVLEIVSDYRGDTWRAVYTIRFREAVYVLHVFQKKSKRGIATPKQEIEVIKRRLAEAEHLHPRKAELT
jgi:phage-related protein